jgi:chemotaxis protein MotB
MGARDRLATALAAPDAAALEADGARADLSTRLGSAEEQNAELGQRLSAAGRSIDALRAKNGELDFQLASLKAAQAAAEARAARERAIFESFRALIDAGDLEVEVRSGRVLLVLPNDVLFESGKAQVREDGRRVLRAIGERAAASPDVELQVGGHTDDTPIATERFPSNWDLSTARAVEVVRILAAAGVASRRLSAAGYGEHRPAASNETEAGRQKNRRIEIALVPDLAPVLAAPPAAAGTDA